MDPYNSVFPLCLRVSVADTSFGGSTFFQVWDHFLTFGVQLSESCARLGQFSPSAASQAEPEP